MRKKSRLLVIEIKTKALYYVYIVLPGLHRVSKWDYYRSYIINVELKILVVLKTFWLNYPSHILYLLVHFLFCLYLMSCHKKWRVLIWNVYIAQKNLNGMKNFKMKWFKAKILIIYHARALKIIKNGTSFLF